jgi:antiviral helicase SKI2
MDDLFDLNDYEDKEEQVIELIAGVKKRQEEVKNLYQIDLNTEPRFKSEATVVTDIQIEKRDDLQEPGVKIETPEEIADKALDDSFETKITIATNKNIQSADAKEKCKHAIDDNVDIKEYDLIDDLAMKFPFELDIFQKRSIIRLERHQNVLVCAHTSSGKTVVAEYAIALGKKLGKRVFYTSPIKALSNQKYREFKQKFGDVGILTGDVSINPDSQCVIMTTEILQSSLYKNSEMLNMVEWVVFDEVHYINDNERGHVWEEILILLPPRIGIVMLSATVPNYLDFAKWVGRIKNTTIYIQNTLKRVVPLEHKIFIATKQIFVAKDKSDKVLEENIHNAMKALDEVNQREFKNKNNPKTKREREEFENKRLNQQREFFKGIERKEKESFNRGQSNMVDKSFGSKNSGYGGQNSGGGYNNNYNNGRNFNNNGGNNYQNKNKITMTHMKLEEIVNFMFKNDLTPAVIFVFSIKKIDEYAKLLSLDTRISRGESSQIIRFFDKCMSKLSDEDKNINQIQVMRRILPQGIGVHHAGLLPILKETIEILYSKGLIKILLATTSFSIGLNMPTRTVVFTDIQKFNEEKKEILSSSEYLQMCGRAGRRGIDQIGHIFLLMGDKKNPPLASDVSKMMGGLGTHVESKFRLSYRTIISFLSRNIKNIMEFFKESYLENNKIMIMPETMKEIEEIQTKLMKMKRIECIYSDNDEYIRKYIQDSSNVTSIRKKLYVNPEIKKKISTGRLIVYNDSKLKREKIALVLHYYSEYDEYRCLSVENNKNIVIEYEKTYKSTAKAQQNIGVHNGKMFRHFELKPEQIVDILDFTIKTDASMLDWDNEQYCYILVKNLDKVLNDILDASTKFQPKPIDYLKTAKNEVDVFEVINKKSVIQTNILSNKCHDCVHREEHKELFTQRKKLEDEFEKKQELLSSENLKYYMDFKNRVTILKKLGYIDEDDQILLKGKAARELATSDCILISELLMSGIMDKLDVPETVAFISGFAFSRNEIEIEDPQISENFTQAVNEFALLLEGLVNLEQQLEFEESKYNRRITFAVSKSISLWMKGLKFRDILNDCDLEEGKLYNLIMRLFLFLEEIKNFYNTLGNTKSAEKFADAKALIMRDILSCRSLYLQEDVDIENV